MNSVKNVVYKCFRCCFNFVETGLYQDYRNFNELRISYSEYWCVWASITPCSWNVLQGGSHVFLFFFLIDVYQERLACQHVSVDFERIHCRMFDEVHAGVPKVSNNTVLFFLDGCLICIHQPACALCCSLSCIIWRSSPLYCLPAVCGLVFVLPWFHGWQKVEAYPKFKEPSIVTIEANSQQP